MISDYNLFHILLLVSVFVTINILFLLNFYQNHGMKYWGGIIIVSLLSFLIGLRARNIGIDSDQYAAVYLGEYEYETLEPVFLLFSNLSYVVQHYTFFFVLVSIVTNLLIFHSFKNLTKHYLIAFALFASSFLFVNINVNVIRQGLALSLFMYSVSLLSNKRVYSYWLASCIAVMTHYTAIVVVFYWAVNRLVHIKTSMYFMILAMVCFWFIDVVDVLSLLPADNSYIERVRYYFIWGKANPWGIKHFYYFVLLMVFAYVFLFDRFSVFEKKLFTFYLLGLLLIAIFKDEEMVADRFFYYFIPIGIVLLIALKDLFASKIHYFMIVYFLMSTWFMKTYFIQYPAWFNPPFEAIR